MAKDRVKQVAVHYKPVKSERPTLSLEKKASVDVAVSRLPFGAQGFDGLKTMNGKITEQCHAELAWPRCLKTYKQMSLDPTISAVNNFYNMMIARAKFKFESPPNASAESKAAAEYLNYCMDNMEDMTWQQFIASAGTYRLFGFSINEKIYTTVTQGKYKGRIKWKSLPPRAQETVDKWKWDKNDPEKLIGVVQKLDLVDAERYGNMQGKTEVTIDRNKFLLFRFDPKKNNPQGTSPLDGCWMAWKYLQTAREYEAIGLGKDLGGTVVIGLPVEKILEAQADPAGPAAKMIESVELNAAKLHAGDSTFIRKPIDYDEKGNPLYTVELMGITGSGKQYDPGEVIKRYQSEILTVFSATMLKLGQDSSGSYALSDNMNNMLAFGVEHNLQIMVDQINYDLVPQTLAINGYLLEEEDMPKLVYDDVLKPDLESLSKYLQRLLTAGGITASKELDAMLYNYIGLKAPTYAENQKIPDEFKSGARTGASQSDGTSGFGGKQQEQDGNLDNTA